MRADIEAKYGLRTISLLWKQSLQKIWEIGAMAGSAPCAVPQLWRRISFESTTMGYWNRALVTKLPLIFNIAGHIFIY